MSLPEKVIHAGPTTLPQIGVNESVIPGVIDPQYLINLKQIPYLQLTRLFDQLTDFTGYANDMFFGLANTSIRLSERLHTLSLKIDDLQGTRMSAFVGQIDTCGDLKPIGRERAAWRPQYRIASNFFTQASQSVEMREAYDRCPPIPDLDILDVFRSDGQSSMKLFSYPDFFVEEWKVLQGSSNKKSRRLKNSSSLDSMGILDRSNGSAAVHDTMMAKPVKVAREKKQVQVETYAYASKWQVTAAPPRPLARIPPPPPPPPPRASMSPGVASASTLTSGKSPSSALSSDQVDRGFLSDIKGNQFKLKKTEVQSIQERKKLSESDGVAAILMRRAALEDDSEDDVGEHEDEWN